MGSTKVEVDTDGAPGAERQNFAEVGGQPYPIGAVPGVRHKAIRNTRSRSAHTVIPLGRHPEAIRSS